MLPLWRRVRVILTVTFTIIAAGMLVLAYALIGRFPGVTVVTLAMIAVVLPIGFYLLATVVGWQRSAASGARPNALVGWIIRNNVAPFLPIMFLFLLLGLGREMNMTPIDQDARSSLSRSMNESCVASARSELTRTGGNPDSAEMKAKAASYCDCVTVSLQREYTPDEFIRLAGDPGRLDKEEKIRRIIDRCAKASSG
jgi:hypothetical protein